MAVTLLMVVGTAVLAQAICYDTGRSGRMMTSSSNNKTPRGLGRFVAATRYSLAGLASAWRSEEAFRQEVVVAIFLIPAAFWIGGSSVQRVLLAGSVIIVLIVELLNSAIEHAVDRIGTDHHPLSGAAKDLASAAVFLSLLLAGLTWGAVLWERFAGA